MKSSIVASFASAAFGANVAFIVLSAFTAFTAFTATLYPAPALGAQPRTQPLEEDRPGIWAKVANERAKGNARKGAAGWQDEDSRCGSIEIGSFDTGGAGGRSRAPRENTVVITGDVINAPGRCK